MVDLVRTRSPRGLQLAQPVQPPPALHVHPSAEGSQQTQPVSARGAGVHDPTGMSRAYRRSVISGLLEHDAVLLPRRSRPPLIALRAPHRERRPGSMDHGWLLDSCGRRRLRRSSDPARRLGHSRLHLAWGGRSHCFAYGFAMGAGPCRRVTGRPLPSEVVHPHPDVHSARLRPRPLCCGARLWHGFPPADVCEVRLHSNEVHVALLSIQHTVRRLS